MKIRMLVEIQILLLALFSALAVSAQDDLKIPPDVKPFIGKDMIAVGIESADLNGDGSKDYILVVENPGKKSVDGLDDTRTLMILTRETDGKLKLAKQNEKVVYCRQCGGVFGDPFASIRIKSNSFTVDNYGGSNWRWSDSYTFNYSRIDRTWQLVKVESETFNALDPKQVKTKIRTPKNFGKIDIADFDPNRIK